MAAAAQARAPRRGVRSGDLRRNVPYWDADRGEWRIRTRTGKDVPRYSPEGERAGGRESFSARSTLRRAGVRVDRGAEAAASSSSRAGRRLAAPTVEAGRGFGELAVYALGTVIGLALLELALSERGSFGASKVLELASAGLNKIVDPHDPIFGHTPAPPLLASASARAEAAGVAVAPASPEDVRGLANRAGGFLPATALYKKGRADQGRDFVTNPGGAIIAPGAGRVVAVKSDPGGFGPAYPVVKFSSGPFAGRTLYIGHVISALKPGARFNSGAVLARASRHGLGNAHTPGWVEIGYAPGGSPGPFGQSTPF